jgi:NTP pyrophosphatase (non-canonical NTP hydrolase)
MNIEQYLIESERTERKFPDGVVLSGETHGVLVALLSSMEIQGLIINELKRHIAYSKPVEDCEDRINELVEAGKRLEPKDDLGDANLTQDQAEVLHALLGYVTEIAEIIPVLARFVFEGKPMDIINLSEELADVDFYKAMLLRKFGIDEADIRQKNIDKLRVRYPDKFSSDNALNRDLEAEKEVLA